MEILKLELWLPTVDRLLQYASGTSLYQAHVAHVPGKG